MDHDPESEESATDAGPPELAWPWGPDKAAWGPGKPGGGAPQPARPPRSGPPGWAKKAGLGAAAVALAGGTFGIVWAVTSGSGGSGSVSSTPASANQPLASGGSGQSMAGSGQSAADPGPGGPGGFGFRFRGPFGGGGPNGAPNQKPTPSMAGTVKNVNGSTVTIQDFMGFTRTIHTSPSTTYTRGGQSATSSAVTNGAQITAQGTVDRNGTDLDASKVAVLLPRVAGTVQSVSGSSFVVHGVDGANHTVTTTSGTTFHKGGSQASLSDVKQDARVVAMGDRQSNGDLTATDVRIAPDRPQAPGSSPAPPSPPGGGTQSGNTT